jgi:murein L,D-transpeptidase YafK
MKIFCLFVLSSLLASSAMAADPGDADRLLVKSLLDISQSRMVSALSTLDQIIEKHPNFRLAQLVRGDLLLAHARPLSTLGNARPSSELDDLRHEARQRVRALSDPLQEDRLPRYLLDLGDSYRHALVVDASRSRLYVFENRAGLPLRVADFYVTVGKAGLGKQKEGDNRTPIGIYSVSGFKPGSELGDFYGSGAFTLSYPNEWDQRLGRNGHGIWIHGTPSNTYSRPPRASEGCVVLANDDMKTLGQFIQTGKTPVIIAEQIDWVDHDKLDASRGELSAAVDQWRRDWESLDTARLLENYSPGFRSESQNYSQFSQAKQRNNAAKEWVKLGLSNVSLMLYPERPGLALVSFTQDYRSNKLSDRIQKRQFWSRENGRWKIIHESQL